MVNLQLVEYVRKQLQAGFSEDEIRRVLIEAGWFEDEINEAFFTVKSENRSKEEKPPAEISPPETVLQTPKEEIKKPVLFKPLLILSLLSGILVIINTIIRMVQITDILNMNFSIFLQSGMILETDIPLIGIVIGIGIITGAILLMIRPERTRITSLLILALSALAILTGNGFLIGGITGAVAGTLGIAKPPGYKTS